MSQQKIGRVLQTLENIILGKRVEIKLSLACLLARGHLLLEDLPGMGKTTLSQAFSRVLGLEYQRIQFTSDLLPGDILGGSIFDPKTQTFSFHKGPIFTEVLLADEINRTTPKSQSALLEAMEERQITIDSQTYALSDKFFVIATQNPNATSSGTFPLPDSQVDRFLMRVSLGYPSHEAEMRILKNEKMSLRSRDIPVLLTRDELDELQQMTTKIHASDDILEYILRIGNMTRTDSRFTIGLSPRGTQALLASARAFALIEGRDYVIPEDVKAILPSTCAHRLRDNSYLEHVNDGGLINLLLNSVPVI